MATNNQYHALVKTFGIIKEILAIRQDLSEKGKESLNNVDDTIVESMFRQQQDAFIDFGNYRVVYNLGEPLKLSSGGILENKVVVSFVYEAPPEVTNFLVVVTNEKLKSLFFSNENKLKTKVKSMNKVMEFFLVNELQFNIMKHDFVPKHERITTKSEYDEILSSLSIYTPAKLPIIHSTDPAARFIGAREGEIVKVVRSPQNVGEHIAYRYCVARDS